VYVEDVDDDTVEIPLSKDAKKLLQNHEKFRRASTRDEHKATATDKGRDSKTEGTVDEGDRSARRPRWQYVAQLVNTRELKKSKSSKSRGYTNDSPENTLVEHDGTLRAATLADVSKTSWKPKRTRHVMEHTYRDAKKGWLDRIVRGDEKAWGKAPAAASESSGVGPDPPSTQ
jgi:hypothetical protein